MAETQIKTYHKIVIFFILAQLLGIFSGIVLISESMQNDGLKELSVAPLPESNDPINAVFFITYIVAGAVMIIIFSRFYKGALLFQLLELSVIFSASAVVFLSIALWAGLGLVESLGVSALFALALAVAKFFSHKVKNAAAIISSSGVGALFGFSLGFLPAVLFVILLSIYDYIAVFKTKHMIEMARELSTRQLSFSVTAKTVPKRMEKEGTKQYFKRASQEGERLDLGTGDLSVPAMLSVSAFTLGTNGLIYSLVFALGSSISLFFLLRFVSKQKVFLPALPPICLGGMLALLLARIAGF